MKRLIFAIVSICIMLLIPSFACTAFYVGKEVSDNGTTIIARTRDSNNMQKVTRRVFNKRIENKKGRVYKEEINGFEIKLPDTTYKYISGPAMTAANVGLYGASCINEYGLAITATVTARSNKKVLEADPFVKTGISEACIGDIVAMCCKTGREAVEFLGKVIKECGNAEPNVIMIADQNEAWLLETYTGHEWAAVKMPKDKIAVFGNQFMIDTINESYEEMICSENIEIMPKKAGVAVYSNGKFDLFNTYSGEILLEDYSQLRNWYGMYLFSKEKNKKYNVEEKMPLFYEPNKKIGFFDIKEFFRSRYEGTEFCPDNNGRDDIRIVGTEAQYSVDITEIYNDFPKEMSVVSWVCLDNAEHSVFIPFSNLLNGISKSWSKDMKEKLDYEDDTAAYYAFQNLCVLGVEGRNSYGKGIRNYWDKVEKYLKNSYVDILKNTKNLFDKNKKNAIKYITNYSNYIQELSVTDARHITKEVMHYLALNQRTFDYKIDNESGMVSGKYEHPDFVSDLLNKVEKRYSVNNVLRGKVKLPIYIDGSYMVYDPAQGPTAIKELVRQHEKFNTEHVKVNTLKLLMDGTLNIRTANMVIPYVDTQTTGGRIFDENQVADFLRELNKLGFNMHTHCVAEGSIKTILDAVEIVKKELGDDFKIKVTIAHNELMRDEDISRFKELGVIANFTPWWHSGACVSGGYKRGKEFLGDRADKMYRSKSLWDTGAMITWSSDNTAFGDFSNWNPMLGFEVGITREITADTKVNHGGISVLEKYPVSSEGMSVEEMILGYTINAAYQLCIDDRKGSIEVGKDADYVVFNEDLFNYELSKLSHLTPSEVCYEGNIVKK